MVKLYNKYKTKGFEILGISLDQNRERWLQAIQADKLTWKHTSDLKGWSNEVSKLYEISAIPKTFLVDPNGMIIEFTHDDPRAAPLDADRRASAHAELKRWLGGQHHNNNPFRAEEAA